MENHINKLLENLAKSFNKDLDKVMALFEWTKNKLAAETGKQDPALSIAAYHAVRAELTRLQSEVGKEINIVFFGKDPSKDDNRFVRNEILEQFWDNPESRKQVIEEGKIMVIKIGKGDPSKDFHKIYKPVTSIEESVEIDGETIVIKGDIWDPALNIDPICRDYRTHRDEQGEQENWNYSKPLDPNWRTTLFGIGSFADTPDIMKKVQIRFFGDEGDPDSPKFIMKTCSPFEPYKMKVQLNEKTSTDDCYVCNAKSKPVLDGELGEELDIVEMMEVINESWKVQQKIKGKEEIDLVPIVSFDELKQWHEDRRAKRDEDGEKMKTDSGWDLTNWNEYCLIDQVTYLGKREFGENYNPAVIQHDSTGEASHFVNYDDNLQWDIPIPSDLLICVKTGRGTSRYDRETNEKIQDDPDPDLSISITGFKVLMSYEKIEFPKELIGDL